MIWWILSTFFSSIATIFWKKSMMFQIKIWEYWFMLMGLTWAILFIMWLIISDQANIEIFTLKNILISISISLLWVLSKIIWQYVYKREKISLIAPYENLNKILSIILAFFLFWDVSVISLCIAILVVIIIFCSSYNFKQKYIPKTIKLFSIHQVIVSWNAILIWYMLLQISAIDFYILERGIAILILIFIVILNKDIHNFKTLPKPFIKNRLTAATFGTSWYLISLYIISEFWITINILLSFIYLIFILSLSYIMLWDKPTKKSAIVSTVVVALVWLWFYFK